MDWLNYRFGKRKNNIFNLLLQLLFAMRSENMMTLAELKGYAKQTGGTDFSTNQESFLDAFLYGEFHEEEFDWGAIAEKLSDSELASLMLALCHALIAGSAENRDGSRLDVIMRAYEAVAKWQRHHLTSPDEILEALEKLRQPVKDLSKGGWIEAISYFQIIESGIRRRMGLVTALLQIP